MGQMAIIRIRNVSDINFSLFVSFQQGGGGGSGRPNGAKNCPYYRGRKVLIGRCGIARLHFLSKCEVSGFRLQSPTCLTAVTFRILYR